MIRTTTSAALVLSAIPAALAMTFFAGTAQADDDTPWGKGVGGDTPWSQIVNDGDTPWGQIINDGDTLTLGNAILGDGFPSRLYQDLRIRSGIVYSVTSGLQWERTRTYYGVSFGADTENIAKARALIIRDIRSMQAEP